jgi:hypothetical protein
MVHDLQAATLVRTVKRNVTALTHSMRQEDPNHATSAFAMGSSAI